MNMHIIWLLNSYTKNTHNNSPQIHHSGYYLLIFLPDITILSFLVILLLDSRIIELLPNSRLRSLILLVVLVVIV